MKPIVYILIILTGLGASSAGVGDAAATESGLIAPERINFNPDSPAVPREIIVKFGPETFTDGPTQIDGTVRTSQASINGIYDQLQVEAMTPVFRSTQSPLGDIYLLRYEASMPLLSALEQMSTDPNVEWVEPNYLFSISATPNDPRYTLQWGLTKIQAAQAWDISQGDPSIVIAILDTGVAHDHEDLSGNIWYNPGENPPSGLPDNGVDDDGNGFIDDYIGWDFVSVTSGAYTGEDINPRDNDPMDFHGHGTHCSGIASAATNNSIGVAGTGWNCEIMAVRCGYKTSTGGGSLKGSDCAAALEYAADVADADDYGAYVISMSWGGTGDSGIIKDGIEYAQERDCVLVAAAGNLGSTSPYYPAYYPGVISVSASNQSDNRPSFSNYGSWVDIAAPGDTIQSTYYTGITQTYGYANMSGTSMATPCVAGVAGLLLSQDPTLTPNAVTQILVDSGDPLDWTPGPDKRLNAYQALLMGGMDVPTDLTATAISSHRINLTWTGVINEDGYKIQRKTGSGSFEQIDTTPADVTTYSDIGLEQNTTYTYRVCAYTEASGNSEWSNEASDTTPLLDITIDTPSGGENLRGGMSYGITWHTNDEDIDHIHLLYSINGTYYQDITANTDDDGSYLWSNLPFVNSSTVQVKAIAEEAGGAPLVEDITGNFTIDSTDPETTPVLDGTEGDNGWYKSDVTVTLSPTDSLSGVKTTKYKINDGLWGIYSSPFDITGSTVYYYSEDNVGNIEAEDSVEINIDKAAPETSLTPVGTEGNNGWYVSDVTVTLSAEDDVSGIGETKYRINDGSWNVYSSPFDVTGSEVDYYSEDNAGNIEVEKSLEINIDKAAPETSLTPVGTEGNDGWYVSDVTVTLSAEDDVSGIGETKYRINDGSWNTYSSPFEVTGSEVDYYSEDNAGNIEVEKSLEINIDKAPPETSVTLMGTEGNNGWYLSDVTVTLSAEDDASGVAETIYKINDGSWNVYSSPFDVTGSTVYYYSEDNAGNIEAEKSVEINIDKTPPLEPVVTDDGDYTYSTTQLHTSWIAIEPESEVEEYRFTIGTTSGGTEILGWISRGTETNALITGLSLINGQTYYFSVKARNQAGLWSVIGISDGITVNPGPEMSNIPNIFFLEDGYSDQTHLNAYVSDLNNPDDEIAWGYAGNMRINVDIHPDTRVVTFTAEQNWSGSETITFTATDPGGLDDSEGVIITVIPVNDPPVVSQLTIQPLPANSGDDLHALYMYSDVDGGTDSSQISWYRNGQHQPIYENLLVLPGSGTLSNEEWYFSVTPSDGMDLGEVKSSPIVLVGEAIQEIFLYAGWNLISIYLQIQDTDILSVLAPIDGLYSSVSTYDADMARWMQYNPDGPDFLNDLDTIEPGRGYFIHMLTDTTLTVTGEQIANTTVVLRPGQNLVGYNSSRPQLREDVQLPVECISIWTYDAAAGIWLRHATSGPNTHNHLTQLEPGKGYTIYVSDYTIWTASP